MNGKTCGILETICFSDVMQNICIKCIHTETLLLRLLEVYTPCVRHLDLGVFLQGSTAGTRDPKVIVEPITPINRSILGLYPSSSRRKVYRGKCICPREMRLKASKPIHTSMTATLKKIMCLTCHVSRNGKVTLAWLKRFINGLMNYITESFWQPATRGDQSKISRVIGEYWGDEATRSWDHVVFYLEKNSANKLFHILSSWDGFKREMTRSVLQQYRESFYEFPRPWWVLALWYM